MGVIKAIEERALSPIIGDGTLTSGAVKLVAGGAIPSIAGRGKISGLTSSAFVIDGVEDIVHAVVTPILMGGNSGNNNESGEW